jgi:predicted NBD/HSP70 family sugar kinase|tara:strand:- start:8500 stop:9807 length:1308 start_codon:yes stop_codon:yes gene_type:complete
MFVQRAGLCELQVHKENWPRKMQKSNSHSIIPMLSAYSEQFMVIGPDTVAGRRGRIFIEICKLENVTRKQLSDDFKLRPGTVSTLVLQLIELGLVEEARPLQPYPKGRPEILLRPVVSRLGVIVFYVVSQSFHAALVDLGGNILFSLVKDTQDTQLNKTEGDRLTEFFMDMINDIRTEAPRSTQIVGVSFSLPGVVDEKRKKWIFSLSRWKEAWNIDFSEMAEKTGLSVILNKNLNCELRARIARFSDRFDKSTLLVHWGHGIGVSCSLNGVVVNSDNGGFGEVGHSQVHCETDTLCRCGLYNCLETQSALWALLPKFQKNYPNVPSEEWEFEKFLNGPEHVDIDILNDAIYHMAVTLRNLAMLLGPQQIDLTGPFVQNREVFRRLCDEFDKLLPPDSKTADHSKVSIDVARAGLKDEIIGAAYPLFENALFELR